ncbi:MAG TPA: hypothetical protein VJB89_00690 [Candidatus Nanoarchaeia archaeon]|nr:hypothetical protein [Candidatus Nanoarchaeia archaeon]
MAYWLGQYFEKELTDFEKIQWLLRDNRSCPRLKKGLEFYCEVNNCQVPSLGQ